jgi:hypothetical protein
MTFKKFQCVLVYGKIHPAESVCMGQLLLEERIDDQPMKRRAIKIFYTGI